MTTQYTPIETRYAGCRFRSRLEARWAVFFDHLGITWEYEPEGFELPSGRYLPDFRLPGVRGGLWIEVKPDDPTIRDDDRWHELALATKSDVLVLFGMPRPDVSLIDAAQRGNGYGEIYVYQGDHPGFEYCWDNYHAFCMCGCGKIGVEYAGRAGRICRHPCDDDKYTGWTEWIADAFIAARSARFEHGQSGATR